MGNQNKKISSYVYAILVLAVFLGIFVWRAGTGGKVGASVVELAACLASKNITMYGADWCPHCQNEKRAFGDAFKQVPYVECPDNPQKCIDAGIKSYSTWVWPDGKRLEGEQGIERLAEESGCNLSN